MDVNKKSEESGRHLFFDFYVPEFFSGGQLVLERKRHYLRIVMQLVSVKICFHCHYIARIPALRLIFFRSTFLPPGTFFSHVHRH